VRIPSELDTVAIRLLDRLGVRHPERQLLLWREHLRNEGHEPKVFLRRLVMNHRLVALGEMHTLRGRELSAHLVEASAAGGADTVFLEIQEHEQFALDCFQRTGLTADLPESVGGGSSARSLPSDAPYLEMLRVAQQCGMKLVAADTANGDEPGRDRHMAARITQYLQEHPNARAIAVVGQLHLLPRPFRFSPMSLVTLVRAELGFAAVATLGRAVPLDGAEFSIWSLVLAPHVPVVLDTLRSPCARLPSLIGSMPQFCDDFDAMLLYPANASEVSAWINQTVSITNLRDVGEASLIN
jgi:hypothetical protein